MIRPIGSGLLFAYSYAKATNGAQPSTESELPRPKPINYQELIDAKGSISRLEKHIHDYESGKGYLSKSIGVEVERKRQEASFGLSGIDPSQVNSFNAYLSSLDYGHRALFVSGVERSVETTTRILEGL